MDINDYSAGYPLFPGYPVGFGLLPDADEFPPQSYDSLTEAEKEQLILQCKDAKTTKAMQRIMDSAGPDLDVRAVMEEASKDNSYKDALK